MTRTSSIMFVGTASDVGKSLISAGFCRVLKQDNYQPAPFKAQNMSLNSFATPEGFEIGRAQAVQAEACKILPHRDMNPILLKPSANNSTQIVLNGKPIGNQSATDYFRGNNRKKLLQQVRLAYNRLKKRYNTIVLEGAGSISEINLKDNDMVNMQMAKYAEAVVYLIADIDKGGVFGSVYGTIQLLENWERKLIKGIIINKFRGDIALFKDGKDKLEELTGIPVIGVIPYLKDIYIDDEDSVSLKQKKTQTTQNKINVAVLLLPHISNYTDFNLLERDKRVNLFYTKESSEIEKADIVILPGTKSTIADLQFLRKRGLVKTILQAIEANKKVIGICGGYQMLGETIEDPEKVEGDIVKIPGIGILPVTTVLKKQKTTKQRSFLFKDYKEKCKGYEIHMGETITSKPSYLTRCNDKHEGYLLNNSWGTYMHGILDNQLVIDDLLGSFSTETSKSFDAFKEENYDRLAQHLRDHLDLDKIYEDITIY